MLQAKSKWMVKSADRNLTTQLQNELQLSSLVATLLVNRGISSVEQARTFLFPEDEFYDPFLLNDMDRCVDRIYEAINKNERIVIYGDYDADGVSSTVVLMNALQRLGADVDYYIPNRFTEGYGPNERAFRSLKEQGFDLMITVDNGISGLHEAQVAKEIGLDLIITDHHEPGEELPEAISVIHPKRPDSQYPFQELAGVGVAFKVATALLKEVPKDLLPFVAIGTIADLVPLKDENRKLALKGIKELKKTKNIGLLALMKLAGINQDEINEDSIGFGLAPRINAAGRMEDAAPCVQLFMTEDLEEAKFLANEINQLNIERQEVVNEITNEAIEQVETKLNIDENPVIIVGKKGWHPGVIGIVASRLVEKYYRPTIVFSYDETTGLAKGSARSISGFNLYKNLSLCKDILPHFGGHPMAAGMTLEIQNVPLLYEKLNQLAKEQLTADDYIPVMELDGIFEISELTIEAIEQMQLLSPFGIENPKPQILVKDIQFSQLRKVGADENHLKFTITDQNHQLDGIAFGFGAYGDHISPSAQAALVGEVGINEWNNIRKPQIYMRDVSIPEWQLFDYRGNKKLSSWVNKVPETGQKLVVFDEKNYENLAKVFPLEKLTYVFSDDDAINCDLEQANLVLIDMPPNLKRLEHLVKGKAIQRIYTHFYQENNKAIQLMPSREYFKWYYGFLYKQGKFDLRRYGNDLAKRRGWSLDTINFMTKVFLDLEFVTIQNGVLIVEKSPAKKDLSESYVYQERQEAIQLEKVLLYSSYRDLKSWFDQYVSLRHEEEKLIWI